MSFLTKETHRLSDELRAAIEQRNLVQDEMTKLQLEFEDYRNTEEPRIRELHRDLEHLKEFKEISIEETD